MENVLVLHKENFEKVIEDIINSSKYMHLREKENPWEGVIKTMESVFGKLFPERYGISNSNPIDSQNIFFIVLLLLIIFLIWCLVKKTNKVTKKNNRIIYGEEISEDTGYEDLYKKALDQEKQGDLKNATRLYFISGLLYMKENSLLILRDSKTNYEILLGLKEKGFKNTSKFKELGSYFEHIWYGNKQINLLDFHRYKETLKDFLLEVKNYSEKK